MRPFRFSFKRCVIITLQCRLGLHNRKHAAVNGLNYGTAARSLTLGRVARSRLTPPASNNANRKPSVPSFFLLPLFPELDDPHHAPPRLRANRLPSSAYASVFLQRDTILPV